MRGRHYPFALGCLFVILTDPFAHAQDASVDQLFEAPQADTETKPIDAGQTAAAFHAQPLSISGSLTAEAGGVVGFIDRAGGGYTWDMTPGVSVVPSLTFTSRPDETLRIQGTVEFASLSFSPTVTEMFFDYTLLNSVFFRVGMHTVSWGITRFFDAGGDLMAASGTGLDIKANVPIGPGGITGVVLATPGQMSLTNLSWRNLTFGAQGDLPIGKSEILLSGTYIDSAATPMRSTLALKTSFLNVDLFAEGIGSWTRDVPFALPSFVSGFYWEHPEPEYKFYGEYYLNAGDTTLRDKRLAVATGMDKAFGSPFTLGLEWTHAFIDNSGIIIPGVSFDPWPHVTVLVGVPCRYGAPGSFYLLNPPPTITTPTSVNDILPTWSQRYGLMFRVTISTGF